MASSPLGYVPGKLIVHGNAAATASNITASETLFRLGVAGELVGQAGFIFVALALYDLLKGGDRRHSSLMVILIVVSIPIAFLNELNSVAALVLVRGADFLSIFDKPQRDALAMLFLKLHGQLRIARKNIVLNQQNMRWECEANNTWRNTTVSNLITVQTEGSAKLLSFRCIHESYVKLVLEERFIVRSRRTGGERDE